VVKLHYLITTKTEGGAKLGSLQLSRDEAAEFWVELRDREVLEDEDLRTKLGDTMSLDTCLSIMGDVEREQEGDAHSHSERKVYTLEVDPNHGFPQMMWGAGIDDAAREIKDLTLISADEHRGTKEVVIGAA
jgi:hypothetical protein